MAQFAAARLPRRTQFARDTSIAMPLSSGSPLPDGARLYRASRDRPALPRHAVIVRVPPGTSRRSIGRGPVDPIAAARRACGRSRMAVELQRSDPVPPLPDQRGAGEASPLSSSRCATSTRHRAPARVRLSCPRSTPRGPIRSRADERAPRRAAPRARSRVRSSHASSLTIPCHDGCPGATHAGPQSRRAG